jgi:hypothetical protein
MKPDRAYKRDLHPPLRHDHQTTKITQRRPLIANSAIIRGQRRRMNPAQPHWPSSNRTAATVPAATADATVGRCGGDVAAGVRPRRHFARHQLDRTFAAVRCRRLDAGGAFELQRLTTTAIESYCPCARPLRRPRAQLRSAPSVGVVALLPPDLWRGLGEPVGDLLAPKQAAAVRPGERGDAGHAPPGRPHRPRRPTWPLSQHSTRDKSVAGELLRHG